ncbi:MAG: class I SAM-dependent methyltransferase [Oceanicaulis sp.]
MYSGEAAEAYSQLGIEGTTYEIAYWAVEEFVRAHCGGHWLDFGCGTGRSTRFLRLSGANRVTGVDISHAMIAQAKREPLDGVSYAHIADEGALGPARFDAVACISVLMEIATFDGLVETLSRIRTALAPHAPGIFTVASEFAYDAVYKTYRRVPNAQPLGAGDTATCFIKTAGGLIEVTDTFWPKAHYEDAFEEAGWTSLTSFDPKPHDAAGFVDEREKPPFTVFTAKA